MELILIIAVLVLLFGGGGYFVRDEVLVTELVLLSKSRQGRMSARGSAGKDYHGDKSRRLTAETLRTARCDPLQMLAVERAARVARRDPAVGRVGHILDRQ